MQSLVNDAPSAFEAQYYGASFGAMELAHRPFRRPPALRPLGHALFQAFEDTIAQCSSPVVQAVRNLQEAPEEISVGQIRLLSELFEFRALLPEEPEHEVLALTVGGLGFESEESSVGNQNRARVFALILAALDIKGSRITDVWDLLRFLVQPAPPTRLQEEFGAELGAWRCFGDRQVQRTAFGGVWSALYEWIRAASYEGVPLEVLKARARELLRPQVERTRSGVKESPSWGEFVERTARACGDSKQERFAFRWDLSRALVAHVKYPLTTEERLLRALQVAAACHHSWIADDRGSELMSVALHGYGGSSRLSMTWMLEQLEERRTASVSDVLDWIVERCVLEQIMRVAYTKPRSIEALLIARDEDRLVLTRPDATVEPLAQDTNRLEAALRLMGGLSLVESTDDGLRPTPTGREFARAITKT